MGLVSQRTREELFTEGEWRLSFQNKLKKKNQMSIIALCLTAPLYLPVQSHDTEWRLDLQEMQILCRFQERKESLDRNSKWEESIRGLIFMWIDHPIIWPLTVYPFSTYGSLPPFQFSYGHILELIIRVIFLLWKNTVWHFTLHFSAYALGMSIPQPAQELQATCSSSDNLLSLSFPPRKTSRSIT